MKTALFAAILLLLPCVPPVTPPMPPPSAFGPWGGEKAGTGTSLTLDEIIKVRRAGKSLTVDELLKLRRAGAEMEQQRQADRKQRLQQRLAAVRAKREPYATKKQQFTELRYQFDLGWSLNVPYNVGPGEIDEITDTMKEMAERIVLLERKVEELQSR